MPETVIKGSSGATRGAEKAVPVRMLALDVEAPRPRFDTLRETHRSAWVLLRKRGRPRSMVEVDLHDVGGSYSAFARIYDALRTGTDGKRSCGPVDGTPAQGTLPSISVVVPTVVGRPDALAGCLDTLAGSDYPRFAVIVVDNRLHLPEPDPLPGILAGRDGVRVVRARQRGISAARNAGIEASDGEIVAFTDDDVRVDPGWLRALGRRFAASPDEAVVTGLVLPAELETPAQLMFERYYGGFSAERSFEPLSYGLTSRSRVPWRRGRIVAWDRHGRPVRSHPVYGAGVCGAGCNMAFRREAVSGVEPFDPALGTGTAARGGEDLAAMIDVLWRGGRVGYEPSAVVHHQHRREYDELVAQVSGYGTGFTAMITSLVWRDRTHLLGLLLQLPAALRRLVSGVTARFGGIRPGQTRGWGSGRVEPEFPGELARAELVGYLRGPLAYRRSRRSVVRTTAVGNPATTP